MEKRDREIKYVFKKSHGHKNIIYTDFTLLR